MVGQMAPWLQAYSCWRRKCESSACLAGNVPLRPRESDVVGTEWWELFTVFCKTYVGGVVRSGWRKPVSVRGLNHRTVVEAYSGMDGPGIEAI